MTLEDVLALLLILSAACYLAMGLRLIAGKRNVGTLPIGMLFVVISFWVVGGAVELLATSVEMFSIGRVGHFVGTAFLPLVAYVAFREYTGRSTSIHRIATLLIIPVVSVTLAATNRYHEFMWYLPMTNSLGEYLARPDVWGPWFLYVHGPYSYALIGAALLALLSHSSAVARAHRRGIFLLVAACLGPLAATAAYDVGLGPNTVSYVPFVFMILLPVYGWLIVGEHIVESAPLAYETVFQNMQDPVVVVDDQGRVIGLNRRAEMLLEVTETSAMLKPLESLMGSDSPEVFEALESGEPRRMLTHTGRFLHVQASPMQAPNWSVHAGKVLMFRDVSDVERAQAEVKANERLLRTLIDHSVNGIVRLRWAEADSGAQAQLRCIFANAAACRFLGLDRESIVDSPAEDLVRVASNAMERPDLEALVGDFLRATRIGESLDTEVRHTSESGGKWLRLICEPFGEDIAVTFVDITDSKAREQHMESIARSDPLTGVLNRRGFERDASERLSDSADDATGALLFIDLNDFKRINDCGGHEVGDQLLQVAARRLRKCLRSCDIIGRPGGDEFVALVPDVTADVAGTLATRLATTLEEPYLIDGMQLHCAASIGLALYPDNASTLTGLLREADQAMYRAKDRCRGVTDIRSGDLLEKAI